jgi:hypothetical protein
MSIKSEAYTWAQKQSGNKFYNYKRNLALLENRAARLMKARQFIYDQEKKHGMSFRGKFESTSFGILLRISADGSVRNLPTEVKQDHDLDGYYTHQRDGSQFTEAWDVKW